MNKDNVIKSINEFKNKPIAPQKSDPVKNSSGDSHKHLMQYNAILDNITIGSHTTFTIKLAGIDWVCRLLTADEYINIRLEVSKLCKDNDVFEDYYIQYKTLVKILQKALSPSPYKLEGKEIFSEHDLSQITYSVLEELYLQYLHHVNIATQKPSEFTAEQIEAFIGIVKKKPEVLRELDRPTLLAITNYYINYSQHLEKMLKSDTSS